MQLKFFSQISSQIMLRLPSSSKIIAIKKELSLSYYILSACYKPYNALNILLTWLGNVISSNSRDCLTYTYSIM